MTTLTGPTTVAGTKIHVSASAPATFDKAGYEALTWTQIGEITDGGSHGRTYAEVKHTPIDNRAVQKYKGSFDNGTKTLQMAVDDDDAGQDVLRAGLASDADYYFKVLYPNGAADYFPAKVMSFAKATAGVDTMRTASCGLSISSSKTGVSIVEVAAPVGP